MVRKCKENPTPGATGARRPAAMLALRPTGRLALASTLLTVACAEVVVFGIRTWTEPAVELEIDAAYHEFDDPLLGYAPLSPIRTRARKRVGPSTCWPVSRPELTPAASGSS